MRDLGYEQHNAILNLGSLAIFSFFYYIKVLFYFLILKPVVYWFGVGKRLQKSMNKSLFYSDILTLTIEAYIEFLISGYLNMTTRLMSTNGEIISNIVGLYSLFMCLIIIPLVFIYVLKQPLSRFKDNQFYLRWEGIYDGVKTSTKA